MPPVSFPPTEPVDCEGSDLLVVQFILDDRQSETTWELRSGGNVLDTGGPYEESTGSVAIQFCVSGSPFIFAVLDAAGDGLCCDFGIGAYRIMLNSEILPTKEFTDGFLQTTPIILPPAEPLSCDNLLIIEFVLEGPSSSSETSWELKKDGVVVNSSEGPFAQNLSSTRSQLCIADGSYIFTVFDSAGDGMDGAYSVIHNGKAIPTGEFSDGFEQLTEFECGV